MDPLTVGVVAAIVGAGISLAGGAWLARRAAARQTRSEEARRYRPVVAEAVAELDKGADAFAVMQRHGTRVDAAITVFRPAVRGAKRARLDAAAATYGHYRRAVQPGMLLFVQSEATGRPIEDMRPQLTHALRELLAVADNA